MDELDLFQWAVAIDAMVAAIVVVFVFFVIVSFVVAVVFVLGSESRPLPSL